MVSLLTFCAVLQFLNQPTEQETRKQDHSPNQQDIFFQISLDLRHKAVFWMATEKICNTNCMRNSTFNE